VDDKQTLRASYREARRAHVAALPESTRRLLFLRPPANVAALAPEGSLVGLYHAVGSEAPTRSYGQWFYENSRTLALPWFAQRGAPMLFRSWHNPFDNDDLEPGPYGALQPRGDAETTTPDIVFVPLIAFTAHGDRLGQGAGHYDRWLAAHPSVKAVGLAWDCQLSETLPCEPHDRRLRAVITPTRYYEGEG
jgi:5-formyltetrahydrofolate cyclo-ligase